MTDSLSFAIPKEALTFLSGLEKNNNKVWFDAHKSDYQQNLLEPLKILVMALGSAVGKKLTGLRYEPKVNGSIFRIYKDTRFSKDKRPYKTHAGVFLWVGAGKKLACPGVYFHLEPKTVILGSGIYMFDPNAIDLYRKYVSEKGDQLAKAITKAEKSGFTLGGEKLKRVPRGFDKDHKHAELLKMKGLWVEKTYPAAKVTKSGLVKWLAREYSPTVTLVKVIERALF